MLTKYRHFTHRSTIHEMTISLNTPSPSETPSKSTTPNLAYRHRPLLIDARLPGGRPPGSYPETAFCEVGSAMGCPHMDVLHSKRKLAEGFVEAACTQLPGLLGVDSPLWKNSMREGRSWQPVNFRGV